MPRHQKQTVEYFSHYCDHKTTIFILEQKYGNDGYAFWFKLLEILGKEDGHFLDLKNPMKIEFLKARTRLNEETTFSILELLVKLEAIDKELWKEKIVWSQNFVNGLKQVYANRRVETPARPIFLHVETQQSPDIYTQESTKKGKEVKEKNNPLFDFELFWKSYPKKASKKGALAEWKKLVATGQLPPIDRILSAVDNQKRVRLKALNAGHFYPEWPDPERWLKKEKWEDDPETIAGAGKGKALEAPVKRMLRPCDVPDPDKEWEEICKREAGNQTSP